MMQLWRHFIWSCILVGREVNIKGTGPTTFAWKRKAKVKRVYLCIIFKCMHSIFGLLGWRHACILKNEKVSHLGLLYYTSCNTEYILVTFDIQSYGFYLFGSPVFIFSVVGPCRSWYSRPNPEDRNKLVSWQKKENRQLYSLQPK